MRTRPILATIGIGAAAQAGEDTVTLHDIDATERIEVRMFGSNNGDTGAIASETTGPVIHAQSPLQFLLKLRKRHHGHR
jgi:hypothetical protein